MRLIVLDSTTSTSTLLREWAAREALPHGLTVVARQQTAARGSRGRGWIAPPGNLGASILLDPGGSARDAGCFALVSAVALTDVLPFIPGLRVKWPNDVMVGPAKLAGILIDAITDAERLAAIVVGVGVNLTHAPDVPGRATCALAGFAIPPPDPVTLAAALRDALIRRAREPFAAITEVWLARADPPGTPLTVTTGGLSHSGTFAGLSPDGHLLLREHGRVIAIATGEILR